MEGGTVQFLVFLLIIILIKESLTDALITPDVSPRGIGKSGDSVTVSWTGVESPSALDWLGIYNPPESEHSNFIGYLRLSNCAGWKSGACSLNISLVNMRSAYQFRLFQGDTTNSTSATRFMEDGDPLLDTTSLLGVSYDIGFANYNEPTQIHLSLTSFADEMRVMFVTRDAVEGFVKYGLQSTDLNSVSETRLETYHQSDMCDVPANSSLGWREPGVIHDAVMQGLEAGKRYYYQVGSDKGGWSNIYNFVSHSKQADETYALLFGDMGTWAPYKTFLWLQAESKNTLKWLQRDLNVLGEKPSFISHIGDISYARGYAWLWDEFFSRIEPVAAQSPYHVCIGNHEYDWPFQPFLPDWAADMYGTDGGGECGVPYSLRFHMPGNSSLPTGMSSPATRNLFYSLSVGVVHFLYFSTETDFLPGSAQYAFINGDLGNVDRSLTPFVVVLGHRPMFSSNPQSKAMQEKMVQYLEPLLVKNNVSLVLWGHVHKYERTCAMQNLTCAVGLPVHVVIGMAGQDWQPSWQSRIDHPNDPIFPQPIWSLFRSDELGYVRLHATKSLLTLEYVGNHDGQVHDVLEISSSVVGRLPTVSCRQDLLTLRWTVFYFVLAACLGGGFGALITYQKAKGSPVQKLSYGKGSWVPVKTEDNL